MKRRIPGLAGNVRKPSGMGTFLQDLRYAARSLRRQPGFTLVAVLTLAVGIGANTAIYTVVDATLLRRLPFPDPGRLMRISLTEPGMPGQPDKNDLVWSYPKYDTFRQMQHSFAGTAIYRPTMLSLTNTDRPERLVGEMVSASYFPVLGVAAKVGRTFLAEEDAVADRDYVAILSHRMWASRYGADAAIVGKKIQLAEQTYTVVGVLPAGFQALSGPADLWIPAHLDGEQLSEPFLHSWQVVARLKPGVTAEQAKREVAALGPRVDQAQPNRPDYMKTYGGAVARTLDEARLEPEIRKSVLVLFGAVGFVLLIACVNLANLLLARVSTRQREMSIRLAVGASRARIVRYLLTESLLLALAGGAASLLLADLAVSSLNLIKPSSGNAFAFVRRLSGLEILGFSSIHLDSRALFFTFSAALATGVIFGLAPAFRGSRADLSEGLKRSASRTSAGGVLRAKNLLIVCEVAMAIVLLTGAGLLIKSFARLTGTPSGIDPENVLTANLAVPGPAANSAAFYSQLEERAGRIPGVLSAGLMDCYALSGNRNGTGIRFPNRPDTVGDPAFDIGIHRASSGYFRTLKIPLMKGRLFADTDRQDSRKVALINETAARRFWPGENPVGKLFGMGFSGYSDRVEVIGVVGDVRYGQMEEPPRPDVYISYVQSPRGNLLLSVRTASHPTAVLGAVREEVHALNRDLPLFDIGTMEERIRDASWRARFSAVLLGVFAAIAVLLSGIGIYGVMSYVVRQRTREIGIRMALGARAEDVRRMILWRTAALAGIGMAIGLGGALALTRVLASLLYQVKPNDPGTYAAVSALLAVLALLAAYLPARRASAVDPAVTLRSE
jgi:putative ABC transport system permease protein